MTYADLTTRDPNPVKRWIQSRRLSDALKVMRSEARPADKKPLRVLDFGAGNGELVRRMPGVATLDAWVFEPTDSLMAEAQVNLSGLACVHFVQDLDAIESDTFDYVFCLEVFEHLPAPETEVALSAIHRALKRNGVAVIGVPHELFLPAALKGLFRMARRYGDFDATPSHILRAVLGSRQQRRPVMEIAPAYHYHGHHLGFDYRDLHAILREKFRKVTRYFSPLPILGAWLNSEVYFIVRK